MYDPDDKRLDLRPTASPDAGDRGSGWQRSRLGWISLICSCLALAALWIGYEGRRVGRAGAVVPVMLGLIALAGGASIGGVRSDANPLPARWGCATTAIVGVVCAFSAAGFCLPFGPGMH